MEIDSSSVRGGNAALTGLGNWVAWVATEVSLLTELRSTASSCDKMWAGARGKRETVGKVERGLLSGLSASARFFYCEGKCSV